MSNRTITMPAVWAASAPNIPIGTPAKGTTYANSDIENSTIETGWPYAEVVASENTNEVMRRVTGLLQLATLFGILPWCAADTYPVGALAMGSNAIVYRSLVTPNLNHDPISSPTYWEVYQKDQVPIGTIFPFAGGTVPTNYLECDGIAISRAAYSGLFAAIGVTYGVGNGSTTFNLPDLRGEFIRGWSHGRSGVDPARVLGSSQLDAIQNITGSFGIDNITQQETTPTGAFYYDPENVHTPGTGPGGVAEGAYANFDASRIARTALETRSRNIALLYIIKY
jgi:hypothetical protein